jgi:hypothetical protein
VVAWDRDFDRKRAKKGEDAMKYFLTTLIAASVAFVSAGGASAATFTDPAGDSNGAPDITAVDVSNDSSGQVTIRLALAGAPSTAVFLVLFDTDQNPATGASASSGAEYSVTFDAAAQTFLVARWDGSQWVLSPYQRVKVTSAATSVTFSLNARDIGGTNAFGFWTRSIVGEPSAWTLDDAPDDGVYSYALEVTADTSPPHVRALPSSGRAGKGIRLTYEVYDDISTNTYERIRVLRKGAVIWTLTVAYGPAERGVDYWVTWKPPKRLVGTFRFCVESWDESKNKSAPSCARVRVRRT